MKFELTLLTTIALAQNSTPTSTTIEQAHFWALTDLAVGAILGAYVPINMYVRDRDCYSRFWQTAALFVEYS